MQSQASQSAIDVISEDSLDPYSYTSGRWLHHDKAERDARYIRFDFDRLCKKVVELCHDEASISSCEKREGGFNRVFIFTCENGKRIVARLPTQIAGPSRLTTNSEVATINYIQAHTTVPVPKILDWSDDPSNAIGSEYIIMEYARGIQLHQKWQTMSMKQKIACVKAITKTTQQIAALEFPAYGSLYFADGPLNSAFTIPSAPGFCVGPHCGTRYSDCNVHDARYYAFTKPNRGPWSDLDAYCDGLIDTGLSRLPPVDKISSERPSFQGSIATHLNLLSYGRNIIHQLSADPRVQATGAATLHHADLHKRNIFVSDGDLTVVTDVIDWQSSSIEPAFEYADETPDYAGPSPGATSGGKSEDKNADICRQAHEACLHGLVPKLSAARVLDDNLLRPFRYCHRTWKDGAVAFRQELIELSSRWKELGLLGECPHPLLTADEIVRHQTEYDDFMIARKLKQNLVEILNTTSDGWVPPEFWSATKTRHKEVFDGFVSAVRTAEVTDVDETMTEEKLRKMWPFDLP